MTGDISYNPGRIVKAGDTLTVTVTLSGALGTAPNISIDTTGKDTQAQRMSTSGDRLVWVYSYLVPSDSDGLATVAIDASPNIPGSIDLELDGATFTIESSRPFVSIAYEPDRDVRAGETLTVAPLLASPSPQYQRCRLIRWARIWGRWR